MTAHLRPIADADVYAVAEFLHAHLNHRVPPQAWARALFVPWKVDAPNHGFMLRVEGRVVGAYLAFYSERQIDGRTEPFCNLGAWCVLPEHRFQSIRLLRALLAQEGYHFTDLSPSGSVVPLNTRMKFQFLDTATALVPNLPWPGWPGQGTVSCDPEVLRRTLVGQDAEIYHDHVEAGAARHLVLIRGDQSCYVVFRRDRRKHVSLFASVLHVSDPVLFRTMFRPFARHLLLHHRIPVTLAEVRVVGARPPLSVILTSPRRKMFRSTHLAPTQVDYLYSELVCLPW
jgi:hypothetical protein